MGGLIRPVDHDRLRAAAEVKGVLVAADTLHRHLIGECALGRVELPITDEWVIRRRSCGYDRTSEQGQSKETRRAKARVHSPQSRCVFHDSSLDRVATSYPSGHQSELSVAPRIKGNATGRSLPGRNR